MKNKTISQKEALKKVMELHIRRNSAPDKAPIVINPAFVMAKDDYIFNTIEEAKEYCKQWAVFLCNKLHRPITCQARYKWTEDEHGFRTVSYKKKYYAFIQN